MSGSKGSWGKTQEAMENQGSSTFLRLEGDGDKAVVAFCGAPFHRDICYNEKTKTYEAWDDAAKAAGRKKSSRYAMNVFAVSIKGVDANEMKVIDMNFNTMQSVIALKDKYGLAKCLFEVTRHGAKGDTKTQYQILPDADISPAVRAACGSPDPKDPDNWIEGTAALVDLEEVTAKGDTAESAVTDDLKKADAKKGKSATNGTAAPANGTAATAPAGASSSAGEAISKAAATEIIEKLKPLDKDKGILPFMQKFPYAKKVSEIRASDEAAARKLASELSSPPSAAAEDAFG
jgi:hypothetical protein